MKTINQGFFALALFCIFSACTKGDLISETNSLAISSGKAAKTKAQNEATTGQVELILSLSNEAKVGKPVTVSYTAMDLNGSKITCGQIMIFQLIEEVWVKVAQASAPSAQFEFVPEIAGECEYMFKAHFNGGSGLGGSSCQGLYN